MAQPRRIARPEPAPHAGVALDPAVAHAVARRRRGAHRRRADPVEDGARSGSSRRSTGPTAPAFAPVAAPPPPAPRPRLPCAATGRRASVSVRDGSAGARRRRRGASAAGRPSSRLPRRLAAKKLPGSGIPPRRIAVILKWARRVSQVFFFALFMYFLFQTGSAAASPRRPTRRCACRCRSRRSCSPIRSSRR